MLAFIHPKVDDVPKPTRGFVKIVYEFSDNPKVMSLRFEDQAVFLHLIIYSARSMTDGFVPSFYAQMIQSLAENSNGVSNALRNTDDGVTNISTENSIDRLVAAGFLEVAIGGYRIHDYLDYQESKADIEKSRKDNANRQSAWRENQKNRNGVSNGVSNTLRNTSVTAQEKEKEKELTLLRRVSESGDTKKSIIPALSAKQKSTVSPFEIQITEFKDGFIEHQGALLHKINAVMDESWLRTRIREVYAAVGDIASNDDVVAKFRAGLEAIKAADKKAKDSNFSISFPNKYFAKVFFSTMSGIED